MWRDKQYEIESIQLTQWGDRGRDSESVRTGGRARGRRRRGLGEALVMVSQPFGEDLDLGTEKARELERDIA